MPPISLISGPPPALVDDAYTNPTASAIYSLGGVWNGATWDRLHEGAVAGSALVDVADRSGRALGAVTISGTPTVDVGNLPATQDTDPVDRAARLLGHVTVDNEFAGDVTDRSGRLLGHVTVDNLPSTQAVSGTVAVSNLPATQPVSGTVAVSNEFGGDVTDRAARLLGHVAVDSLPALPAGSNALGSVSVSNFPATQPVSGTVSLGTAAPPADAASAVTSSAVQYVYNGTSFDRVRSVTSVTGTAGTGLLGAGVLGWDGTNYQRISANLTDATSVLYTTGMLYASGWQIPGTASGMTDASNPTGAAQSALFVYNGTNFDRMRSANAASNSTGTGLLGAGLLGWDGTNYQRAGALVGDTGQNALLTAGNRKEVSFSTTTAQAVASTDVGNYRSVSVHVVSQGTGSTITFQGSNDNLNWIGVGLPTKASTTSAGAIYEGMLRHRYFRLNVTGISAGTTSGVVEFFGMPSSTAVLPTLSDAFGQAWNGANIPAVSNMALSPSAFTAQLLYVASADALGTSQLPASGTMVYNGTSFDRARSAAAAANTTGTGLLGAAQMVYDGTNYQLQGGFAGDSGQNAALVAGNRKEVSFSTTVSAAVASTDVSNFRWISVQINGVGTGATINFQGSNDNVNWYQAGLIYHGNFAESAQQSTTIVGIYNGPAPFRYFRLNVTGQSAGTTSGVVEFFAMPSTMVTMGVSAFLIGTSVGDNAGSAPVPNSVWNGTSYDRQRSAGVGDAAAATGLTVAAQYVYNGTTWERVRASSAIGDNGSATGLAATGLYLYNGSFYDRARTAPGAPTGTQAHAPMASSAGGATPFKLISAATTNATSVKATAGTVYAVTATNTNAAVRYLKLYDKATAPTVGTDVPVHVYPLPANAAHVVSITLPTGMAFANGIALAITAAIADNDATAVAANDVAVNLDYK